MSAIASLADLYEPQRCVRSTGPSKACYRSRAKAMRAVKALMSEGRPRQYAYQCPRCGFWHLTKQEQAKEASP